MKTYFSIILLLYTTIGFPLNSRTIQFPTDTLNIKKADSLFKRAQDLVLVEKKYEEAKSLFIETDSLYQRLKIYDKVIASKVNITSCLFLLWEPPEIQKVPIEQALEYVHYLDDNHFDVGRLYGHYSVYKQRAQEIEDAKYYLLKEIKILSDTKHDHEPNIQKERYYSLNNLASIEKSLYNFDKAEVAFFKALDFAKANQFKLTNIYSDLLNLYLQDKSYDKFEKLLESKEIQAYDKEHTSLYVVFGIETTKAAYYRETMQYDLAIKTLLDFQEYVSTSKYNKHISDKVLKTRLSHIYYDMGDYNKVIELLKSIKDNDKNWLTSFKSDELKLLALSYFNIGDISASKNAIKEAIGFNYKPKSLSDNFHEEIDINKAKFKDFALLKALVVKGDLSKQIYDSTNKKEYLKTALLSYQNVHELIKVIGSMSEEDKFISDDEFKEFYENLLEIYHLNWIEKQNSDVFFNALSVCDESKNVTILSELKSIKHSQLQKSIPKSILKREQNILKVFDSIQSVFSDNSHQKSNKVKDSIEQEFNQFKKELKAIAPNYYDVKYENEKPIEALIKSKFKTDNIIEFFFGNNAIYVFKVNNKKQIFDKILITDSLKNSLDTVIESLQNRDTKAFKKSSAYVYKVLFKKYLDLNKRNKVVLDGKLHLLPIESLWVPSKTNPHFLIEDISVVRLNSITQNFTSQTSQTNTMLFAPFATHDGFDKTKLSSSENEVNQINQIIKGKVYLDENANKEEFIEHAINSSVIHLATHSSINIETPLNSKIYFYDNSNLEPSQNYLKIEELYALKLNSNLVTLSACETGIGKEVKGKGVISLSNAFAFTGVKSTVMSLWKVPDQETSTLMVSFYENLNNGQDKDEALRNAKLDYLNATNDEVLKHPYYWAGFVISGDTSQLQNAIPFYYYLLIAIFLLVLFVLIRRFFNKKKSNYFLIIRLQF